MLTHKGTHELITRRLRLRKYEISDAESMFRNYLTDERVTRFMPWEPYKNIDEARSFLTERIAECSSNNVYFWAIEFDGETIGGISASTVDEKNCSCEVGYCIGYSYWNKGIASEALNAIMGYLFNEVNMHRIMAKHDIENPASGMVMKKSGMTYEGKLREHYLRRDGTFSDSLVYGILKDEYIRR